MALEHICDGGPCAWLPGNSECAGRGRCGPVSRESLVGRLGGAHSRFALRTYPFHRFFAGSPGGPDSATHCFADGPHRLERSRAPGTGHGRVADGRSRTLVDEEVESAHSLGDPGRITKYMIFTFKRILTSAFEIASLRRTAAARNHFINHSRSRFVACRMALALFCLAIATELTAQTPSNPIQLPASGRVLQSGSVSTTQSTVNAGGQNSVNLI